MRKRTSILVALPGILAACSSKPQLPSRPTGAPAFEIHGEVKGAPVALGAEDLAKLPRRSFRAIDRATGRDATYEGASVAAILDRARRKPGVDTVLVHTQARQAVPVPLWMVWQLRPVLADRADGAPLPGLVLAWPNAEQSGIDSDPRAMSWWAHGVEALEFVQWPAYARSLAPPPGSPDAVRFGAALFQSRCFWCHEARGRGGSAGPDLTDAASRLSAEAFARAVRSHRAFSSARPDLVPTPEDVSRVRAFLLAIGKEAPGGPEAEPADPAERREADRTR
jgi:hypothetical protein